MPKEMVETIRDGAIEATILRIETEINSKKVTFFPVRLARTYLDESGKLQRSDSFTGTELLRLARLAERAYDRTAVTMARKATGAAV